MTNSTPQPSADSAHTIAIIGGGSAAEALLRELEGGNHDIVVFEPELVGGECPFVACMPSKAMLHDRATGRDWTAAVARRDEIAEHLDDTEHADQARELGATIVRSAARIVGPGRVDADGVTYSAEHIVIATGATPVFPDIEGLNPDHPRVWTSRDVLTATEQPESIVIVGGGVIGSELAFMFAGFGTTATTLDASARPADDLHPRVGELIEQTLTQAGVDVVNGIDVVRIELTDQDATVHLADGAAHTADRVVVAVGRVPHRADVGLDAVGVDPDDVEVTDAGKLRDADGSVWVVGDAAGRGQYTHVANHHAAVVANHIDGDGSRSYVESVIPACIFIDPPVMIVGPTWTDLQDDDDVVWAEIELATPRSTTDDHGPGFLAVATRRSTGCIVAAHGIGARFDEIVHALVVAIDGEVPVSRLVRTIQPFPTVGEVLSQAFASLSQLLES